MRHHVARNTRPSRRAFRPDLRSCHGSADRSSSVSPADGIVWTPLAAHGRSRRSHRQLGVCRHRRVALAHDDAEEGRLHQHSDLRRRAPRRGPLGSGERRLVQGLRRGRRDAHTDPSAHRVEGRRCAERGDRRRSADETPPLRSIAAVGTAIAAGTFDCGVGIGWRTRRVAQRQGLRRREPSGRIAKGRHHQPDRGLAAQERRRLQREHEPARVLGPRDLPEWRHLADRHDRRQRSSPRRLSAHHRWRRVKARTRSRRWWISPARGRCRTKRRC